jgi:PAS domain S-box-containing protein
MTEHIDRSQLQDIIAELTDGVILIEPDGTITYANEAALRMHGAGRLEELGADVAGYRQNFALRYRNNRPVAPGQSPIERVAAGEAFEDVVVVAARRDNSGHDWIHRVRGLVLDDGAGRPDCLVLIVHDASAQYEAEDRFERAFSANPAPAVICRLADLRYVKLNEGFLEMTGFRREDVLGRSVYEIDVLERAERRELAIERLKAGETIPQMEACLRLPKDSERLVIVAGQPIEIGAEPFMLFTFADLEPRRKAETALRQSEERFAKSFRLSPVPTTIGTADRHRFIDVNDAFVKAMGYASEEAIGRAAGELGLWADERARRRFETDLARTGSLRDVEARLRSKDGAESDCLVSAETVAINGEPCILCVFQDITERRRTEAELVEAIEAVMADASWFSRGVIEKLAALRQPARPAPASGLRLDQLTRREREVLALISRGASNAEIGEELKLSRNTVRNHVASLYRKLGVNRRSAVVIWARERGIATANLPARQPQRPKK